MLVKAPLILLTTAPTIVRTAPGDTLTTAPATGITALSDTLRQPSPLAPYYNEQFNFQSLSVTLSVGRGSNRL